MTKTAFSIFSVFLFLFSAVPAAFAQADVQSTVATAEDEDALKAQEEAIERTNHLITELFKKLNRQQQRHYYVAYNNYNLIETVKIVKNDVSEGVEGCAGNNPEMKDEITGRFSQWSDAVNPVLHEAEGHLNNMVIAQDYADPKELEAIFDSVDKTREYTKARIEKVPVTTREACEFLLGKMDETQKSMLGLLRATLVSLPPLTQEEPSGGSNNPASEGQSGL